MLSRFWEWIYDSVNLIGGSFYFVNMTFFFVFLGIGDVIGLSFKIVVKPSCGMESNARK